MRVCAKSHVEVFKRLEEKPHLLLQVLACLDSLQCDEVLKDLIRQLNDWKAIFQRIFQKLDRSFHPSYLCSAYHFQSILFTHLPERCSKSWIKYCTSHLSAKDWAFFILPLTNKQLKIAINRLIYIYPLHVSIRNIIPYFEALAHSLDYRESAQSVLLKLLQRFYLHQCESEILDNFTQLSVEAQVSLLHEMSPKKQCKIFSKEEELSVFAGWLDGLFHCLETFKERQEIIKRLFHYIKEEEIDAFLTILNERRSGVGPYLLISLPLHYFEDFICVLSHQVRSQLLYNGTIDSSIKALLDAIKNNEQRRILIYENSCLDLDNSKVPIDPNHPLTLKTCFELLKELVRNEEQWSNYCPLIERIPPILMGLYTQKQKETLLQMARCFTEAQLKCLIASLPSKNQLEAIDHIKSTINSSQYLACLEILPSYKLKEYVVQKTDNLQDIYQNEFLPMLKELQEELHSIKGEELIARSTYKKLEGKAQHLRTLIRQAQAMDYRYLMLFLEQPDRPKIREKVIVNFKQARENFIQKSSLFEGQQAIIGQYLKYLEQNIDIDSAVEELDEIDLTLTLYSGFWCLVREGTLPYLDISPHSQLGITHPGQLFLLGIHTNQDLEYLGISQQCQEWFDRMGKQLEELILALSEDEMKTEEVAKRQKEKQFEFKIIWQNFTDIRHEDNHIFQYGLRLLELLDVENQQPEKLRKACLNLYEELLEADCLMESERNPLIEGKEKLITQENLIDDYLTLLKTGLMLLRQQSPLVRLQSYLRFNVNLKETWEGFRAKGCPSIQSLVEKGYIQRPSDLLLLNQKLQAIS